MAFFQRKRTSASATDPLRQARERHPSTGGKGIPKSRAVRLTLGKKDWAGIDELLSKSLEDPPPAITDACLLSVENAIAALRSFVQDQRIVGATHVRDWLLDLWSATQKLDADVGRPAEAMLTGLVGRDLVSAEEIRQVCDRTERAAIGARSAIHR